VKYLVVITARKNSKRVPGKNILKVGKKLLFEHTLDFAKKTLSKYPIYMSTDCKIIKKICQKKSILCPALRPEKLSDDNTRSADVLNYVLKYFEKFYYPVDAIILLQPTTPFRRKSDLKKSINLFEKNYTKYLSVVSVSNKKKKIIKFNLNKNNRLNTKCIETSVPNGSIYIISSAKIKNTEIYGKNTYYYKIKGEKYNIDIDSYVDLEKFKKYLPN